MMELENRLLSVEDARATDMVDYLSRLGHEPAKTRGVNCWYHSPLRNEKTPSFKVNRDLNRWYDFGLGEGGNIIDFGIRYHQCSVAEFLRKINGSPLLRNPVLALSATRKTGDDEGKVTILQEGHLASFPLLRYLGQRRIPVEIAELFCREISYRIGEKKYHGIGFGNDAGGYEIRTPFSKISSSPKDITTVRNGAGTVRVFEGFADFLSFLAVSRKQPLPQSDFVVLNSVSLFEKARPFMEQHESVRLYLDNDEAGRKCTKHALSLGDKYADESRLYAGHKDVNEWLVNTKNLPKKNRSLKV